MTIDTVDLTLEKCPLTLLRAAEALAPLKPGQSLDILVKGEEPVRDMTVSLKNEGHSVISVVTEGDCVHRIRICRGVITD